MNTILSSLIFTEDKILKDKAIVFDKKIIDIIPNNLAYTKYPNSKIIDHKDDVILPAFINAHIHLEFNPVGVWGDFLSWLKTIVKSPKIATNSQIKSRIDELITSGVGTIAEISSFGGDVEILKKSNLRSIIFSEAIGSNKDFIDLAIKNFDNKFINLIKSKNKLLKEAIEIHSPYSTHPKLLDHAINLAKQKNLLLCTHLLESGYEKKWLNNGNGGFKSWLKTLSNQTSPMYKINEFIKKFDGLKCGFIHCNYVDDFEIFDKNKHFIIHCNRSNRLLGSKLLNLNKIKKSGLKICIGTDGLSSNESLNFFDEIRAIIYSHKNINEIDILKFCTTNPAEFLGIDTGAIEVGKLADFMVLKKTQDNENLLNLFLQTRRVKNLFLQGEQIC